MLRNETVPFPSQSGVLKSSDVAYFENYTNMKTPRVQHKPSLVKKTLFIMSFFQPSALLHDPLEHRKLIYPFFSRGFMICLAFMRFITASNCRIDLRPDFIT